MDFSKFRSSGDLSDIKVTVDSHEYNLHKFPLYARSDYFCELARSKPGSDVGEPVKIELKDFPGGNDIFGQVADFCYNMSVNLTKSNIVAMRCAAEYLKMFGPGNLKDVATKFLMDTLTSAKLNRSTAVIVSLLLHCNDIGEVAKDAGIVDLCLEALVECWMKPGGKPAVLGNGSVFTKVKPLTQHQEGGSAFTRVQTTSNQPTSDSVDEISISSLMSLRVDWFANLLTKARIKGVNYAELGNLAVRYISSTLDKNRDNKALITGEQATASLNGKETSDTASNGEKDVDTHTTSQGSSRATSPVANVEEDEKPVVAEDPVTSVDVGAILDKIVLVLPEQSFSVPSVTMEWMTKVLRVATANNCECRAVLMRMAGEMLTKLGPEELCIISPSVLHDIVVDAEGSNNTTNIQRERACKLVDTYNGSNDEEGKLLMFGVLTAETFRLLASATKSYTRQSHDSLYDILEFVLKSEKDKLTADQRTEMTEFVNFDLLSETSLQKALDEDIVPATNIASSAIKLCSQLRSELASVKYIAEMQEEDIQKYQNAAAARSVTKSLSPPPIAEPRRFPTVSARERNIDSGYADGPDSGRDKSPLEDFRSGELGSGHQHTTDPLKAAQSVLTAARHKLALPVYTGYRPALLTRLSPPTSGGHAHSHGLQSNRGGMEHDISLEEELEFKFDRSFRSLDPRVRHHRLGGHYHQHHNHHSGNNQRAYFPYSNYSHRF